MGALSEMLTISFSIWTQVVHLIDGNEGEGVLHIPQSSRIGASPSNGLISRHPFFGDVLFLYRDAVGLFYCPYWLVWGPDGEAPVLESVEYSFIVIGLMFTLMILSGSICLGC